MALDIAAQLAQVRHVLEGIQFDNVDGSGRMRAYDAGATDSDQQIPMALNDLPCAIVMPQRGRPVYQGGAGHGWIQHDYMVEISVYQQIADFGGAFQTVLPWVVNVMLAFAQNIKLGQGSVSCSLANEDWAFGILPWAGVDYLGYTIPLAIRESVEATIGVGGNPA